MIGGPAANILVWLVCVLVVFSSWNLLVPVVTASQRSPCTARSCESCAVHETRLPTRWVDFDALAHVTHAVYPVFLDEAWDDFLSNRLGSFSDWPYVLVHVSIDYRRELRHPTPEVLVRTRVVDVGRTSVTFEQEVCGPDGEPAASARCVIAAWDADARATRAISKDERAKLLDPSP